MKLKKDVIVPENENISIVYTDEFFNEGDTNIAIYDKYKISIILSNGLNAVTNNSVIQSRKNDIIFFRPDEIHFGRISKDGNYSYLDIFIPISFFESFKDNNTALFLTDKSDIRVNLITPDFDERIKISELSRRIIKSLQEKDNNLTLFSLVLDIIILCADKYKSKETDLKQSDTPPIVSETMEYLSENFENRITLKELSQNAKCSVAYLSRTFKEHTNMTVYGYLTNIRIANAQIMLKNGLSVTEACFQCGFNSCSNFIDKFKKITGTTPHRFKNSL